MIDSNTFTKIAENVGYLANLIVAKGFKTLPKVQYITQSGHTYCLIKSWNCFFRNVKNLFTLIKNNSIMS